MRSKFQLFRSVSFQIVIIFKRVVNVDCFGSEVEVLFWVKRLEFPIVVSLLRILFHFWDLTQFLFSLFVNIFQNIRFVAFSSIVSDSHIQSKNFFFRFVAHAAKWAFFFFLLVLSFVRIFSQITFLLNVNLFSVLISVSLILLRQVLLLWQGWLVWLQSSVKIFFRFLMRINILNPLSLLGNLEIGLIDRVKLSIRTGICISLDSHDFSYTFPFFI